MTPQAWVGGVPLSAVGSWGELTVEDRWPYGCWETTWQMTTSQTRKRPRNIVAGAHVEVRLGPSVRWSGRLTEPDWNEGQFVAQGYVRQGEQPPCLTAGGLTTTIPDTAIDNAITRGWVKWRRTASISSAAYVDGDTGAADATDSLNTISALLDAYTLENSLRWAVGPDQRVYTAADPTDPKWDIMPDTQALGVAQDKLAGTIVARWQDSAGKRHTTIVTNPGQADPAPVVMVELGGKGPLTSARITSIANGILKAGAATSGWTNPLTVTASQINHNGVSPHLGLVKAGHMVRLLGQRDPRGLDATTKVVVGASAWNVAEGTLTLSPVDMAARDLASIVATAGGELVS